MSKYSLERSKVEGEGWVELGQYDTEDEAIIEFRKLVRNGEAVRLYYRVVKLVTDSHGGELVTASDICRMFNDFCNSSPSCIDCEYGMPGCAEKTSVDCLARFIKEWKEGVR